jgi:alkylhydroperoxidase family enzyme
MSRRMNYNAVSPAGMKALGAAHGYIRQSGLPSRLVDLVFLRVSQINGCAYCIDAHSRDFRPRERCPFLLVEDVASFGPCGDEDEVLDRQSGLEEVVTRLGDQGVPDSAFEAAAAAFDEKQLADLTIAIALMNAYNRIAISFHATPMALAA